MTIEDQESELKVLDETQQELFALNNTLQELQIRKRQLTNRIDEIKNGFKEEMVMTGIVEDTIGNYKLKISKSKPSVVIDCEPNTLPKSCQKIKIEPNKVLIGELLKNGEDIEGCKIKQNHTLKITYLDNK